MTSFIGYYEVANETGSLKQSHTAIQQNNDPVSKWLYQKLISFCLYLPCFQKLKKRNFDGWLWWEISQQGHDTNTSTSTTLEKEELLNEHINDILSLN